MEKINKCLKCGKKFGEGELKYKINIVVASDFDGVLGESEEEMEDEVYKEVNFLLCKPCRDIFLKKITDLQIKQIIEDEDLTWQ